MLILWVIINWAVCTLLEGKGKLRHIFVVSCYALLPKLISTVLMLVFSYTLLPDESGIIDVILTVSDIWFYLLIFLGTMSVHEFTFARTFGTTILTLLGMALSVFILLMILILFQDFYSFLVSVFKEIALRRKDEVADACKRVVALIASVLLALPLATACSSKGNTPRGSYDSTNDLKSAKSGTVASNKRFTLLWDEQTKSVFFQDKQTSKIWGTVPYEYYFSGASNADLQLYSPITIEYIEPVNEPGQDP